MEMKRGQDVFRISAIVIALTCICASAYSDSGTDGDFLNAAAAIAHHSIQSMPETGIPPKNCFHSTSSVAKPIQILPSSELNEDPCSTLVKEACLIGGEKPITDISGTDKGSIDDPVRIQEIFDENRSTLAKFIASIERYLDKSPSVIDSSLRKSLSRSIPTNVRYRQIRANLIIEILKEDLSQGEVKAKNVNFSDIEIKRLIESEAWIRARDLLQQRILAAKANKTLKTEIQKRVFPKMQKHVTSALADLLPRAHLGMMTEKISTIRPDVDGSQCKRPISANAMYWQFSNTNRKVILCGGKFLGKQSALALGWSIAHEIAHASDPYELYLDLKDKGVRVESENELESVKALHCLRKATDMPSSSLSELEKDPIRELWADFVGIEGFVRYLRHEYPDLTREQLKAILINGIREKACKSAVAPHPSGKDRVSKTLLRNPWIRERLGCPKLNDADQYCMPPETELRN